MTYDFAMVPRGTDISAASASADLERDPALGREISALQREELAAVSKAFKHGITPETLRVYLGSYVEPIQASDGPAGQVNTWTIGAAKRPEWLEGIAAPRWQQLSLPRPAVLPAKGEWRPVQIRRAEVAREHEAWLKAGQTARNRVLDLMKQQGAPAKDRATWESNTQAEGLWPVPGRPLATRMDHADELQAAVAIGSFMHTLGFVGDQASRLGRDVLCLMVYDSAKVFAFDMSALEEVVASKSMDQARAHAKLLFEKHRASFLLEGQHLRAKPGPSRYMDSLSDARKVVLDDHEQCLGEYLIGACKWKPQAAPNPADRFVDLADGDLQVFVGELERVAQGDLRAPVVVKVGDEYGPSREMVRRVLREFSNESGHENAKTMAKLLEMARKARAKGNRILVYWEA